MFLHFLFILKCTFIIIKAHPASFEANKSINQLETNFEWERDYLLSSKIAKSLCDLTEGFCDSFCCGDKDCNEWQKQSFQCSVNDSACDKILSKFDCNCGQKNKPEWFPLLCFVYSNPVYLGMFYKPQKKIDGITDFKNKLKKKHHLFKFTHKDFESKDVSKPTISYKYGSKIMTYLPTNDSLKFPIVSSLLQKVTLLNSHHACQRSDVKFRVNTFTSCLTKLSEEHCNNDQFLSDLPFFPKNNASLVHGVSPMILKNVNFLEGSNIEVTIKCVILLEKKVKFGRQQILVLYPGTSQLCDHNYTEYNAVFTKNKCANILVTIKQKFMVNGSDIIKVHFEYTKASAFPFLEEAKLGNNNAVFVKQNFSTEFSDVLQISSVKQNIFKHDSLANRGYFIGEKLKFGYKR